MDQQEFQAIMQAEKEEKKRRFHYLNAYARKGQIVFAGSSLMEQFPIYEFLLDDGLPYMIYNRGIGGFTSSEMLESLEECIFELKPNHIFLNIGTNDLNGPDYRQEKLLENYEKILDQVRCRLPEARLYLLAYYPVNPEAAHSPAMEETFRYRTNDRIRQASAAIQQLAARSGAAFLDLNEGLLDENGNLKKEFTIEGMHMYANGYRPVWDALLPVLENL